MIVGIIGENKWARGLYSLVAEAGNQPRLGYQKRTIPGFKGTPNLPQLAKDSDLLIFACPPNQLTQLVAETQLQPRNLVLISAQGLEPETGSWLSSIVSERSPAIRVGALAGPALPDEIEQGHPSALVVASQYQQVCRATQKALHSSICRIYSSFDMVGVELAGVIVEVLSIGLGLADSLNQGAGARGVIVARGLAEASRLGKVLGADEHSFLGLAGVGDIIASGSANPKYHIGTQLGKGKSIKEEHISDIKAILLLAKQHRVNLPLTEAIYAITLGKLEARLALDALMRREATAE